MELKCNKKVIYEVDYYDFEKFVESKYGGNLEIVALEEKNNNSSIQCEVPVKYLLDDKKEANKIRSGEYPMYSTYAILRCLHEDGFIEEGEYLITISW